MLILRQLLKGNYCKTTCSSSLGQGCQLLMHVIVCYSKSPQGTGDANGLCNVVLHAATSRVRTNRCFYIIMLVFYVDVAAATRRRHCGDAAVTPRPRHMSSVTAILAAGQSTPHRSYVLVD